MPNNIPISLGSGASLATDQVAGLHYPYTKIASGVAGEENYWDIDTAGSGQVRLLGNVTIDSLPNVTVGSLLGNVTIDSGSVSLVGNVTVDQVDVVTAVTDITNPVALKGNLTIDSGTVSLSGNVTVQPVSKNFQNKNFGFSAATNLSGSTIFVGGTANYHVTNFMLSANATVGVAIMSGVTYLVGNASIRATLHPGGGFVRKGGPENPVWKSLSTQQSLSIVQDKAVSIAGDVTYYEE